MLPKITTYVGSGVSVGQVKQGEVAGQTCSVWYVCGMHGENTRGSVWNVCALTCKLK